MSVGTMLANHFQFSGGTETKMSDAKFIAALRKSAEYWKDKALVRPYLDGWFTDKGGEVIASSWASEGD